MSIAFSLHPVSLVASRARTMIKRSIYSRSDIHPALVASRARTMIKSSRCYNVTCAMLVASRARTMIKGGLPPGWVGLDDF